MSRIVSYILIVLIIQLPVSGAQSSKFGFISNSNSEMGLKEKLGENIDLKNTNFGVFKTNKGQIREDIIYYVLLENARIGFSLSSLVFETAYGDNGFPKSSSFFGLIFESP